MADLTYKAELIDNISPELKKIQSQVEKTGQAFAGFQKVLGGLAIGSFITNSVRMAAALDDVSVASGIALDNVIGFGQAVAANGGSVEGANSAIGRFAKFIDDAASGSKDAQEKFAKLGISLDDLRTLSEADLLRKTVTGLAQTNDNATRSAIGMGIFGKAFNSVDFKGVNGGLDGFIQRAGPAAASIKAAAEAEEAFAGGIRSLQTELLKALQPISDFARALDPKSIQTVVTTLIELGKIVAIVGGAFAVFKYAVAPLRTLQGNMAAVAVEGWKVSEVLGSIGSKAMGPIKGLVGDLGNLKDALFGGAAAGLAGATGLERFGLAMGSIAGIVSRLVGWITVLYAAFEILKTVWNNDWVQNLAKSVGLIKETAQESKAAAAAVKAQVEAAKKQQDDQIKKAEKLREVEAAGAEQLRKYTEELQKGVAAYQNSNAQSLKKLELEKSLIGLTEEQKQVKQSLFDAESTYLNEVSRLTAEYQAKSSSGKKEDLDTLPKIQAAIQAVTDTYRNQIGAVEELTRSTFQKGEVQKQTEAFAKFSSDSQIDSANELQKIYDDFAKLGLNDVEKKHYDIARAAENSARRAIQAENERRKLQGVDPMTAAEERKYYDVSIGKVNKLIEANDKLTRGSRTFSTGWRNAWQQYADNATNAATQAEQIFSKITRGMEDTIVNFVKTGKFEFKSFVADILETLLRSQIQQTIAGIFNPGAIGGGMPQLLGGPQQQQGGGGGSILGAIGGIVGGVTDFIGDLFGGGRANGGPVSAGKTYMVGERGPELFSPSGSGSIIPNGGGTNVTYNINAVDAASFKQMVAADPGFIHAVAMQGAGSIPRRR